MATVVTTPARTLLRLTYLRYWHLLSLDAPTVAALWTWYVAWQFSVPLPPAAPLALATAVWVLYALDRIFDARRGDISEDRHAVHLRHQRVFLAGCSLALVYLPFLILLLPRTLRLFWISLAIPLAAYMGAVHLLAFRRVPKELLVAIFFGVATAAPVVTSGHSHALAIGGVAICFGLLCWLNCAAIARWEQTLSQADGATAWLGTNLRFGAILLFGCSTPLLCMGTTAPIAIALAVAAAALLWLDRARLHLEAVTVRALADASLLTPLLIWPLAYWLRLR